MASPSFNASALTGEIGLTGRRRLPQPWRRPNLTLETLQQVAGNVSAFNVVILYERLIYVGKAMATYLHLMRELADDFAPDFRLWRMDVALEPAFAAEAERDIAAAEVLIIAVNGHQPCPSAFQRWKNGVGQIGGQPPRAIIALMGASDEPAPAAESWTSVLRSTATQIHSQVFVYDPPSFREGGTRARQAALAIDYAAASGQPAGILECA